MTNATAVGSTEPLMCYNSMMIAPNGVWLGSNPFQFALPLFILQVIAVILTTRVLVLLLRPFHQPRVIAEIISGIILGPSVMGRIPVFGVTLFPKRSSRVLETMAHFGITYFLFLVGLEMDLNVIRHTGKKAMVIAVAGMILPFTIGTSASLLFRHHMQENAQEASFLIIIGIALSVTAFPVLARILAETKLLNSELGRISMSSAIVNDMCAWILLAVSFAVSTGHDAVLGSMWVLLSAIGFVLVCFYAVRPLMWWLIRRIPEGEPPGEFQVCCVLTGATFAALITDAIGIHAVFGAFVFGLVMPNGPMGVALIEKMEDFVTGLLLPLFFVLSGLKTDMTAINDFATVGLLVLIFVLAGVGKITGTVLISLFYKMPLQEGISLGFLMNTKGLVEMIFLNIGREKEVLDRQSFAVLVVTSLAMTATVTPMVSLANRPSRLPGYTRRDLQRCSKLDSELRVLACVHNVHHTAAIISLLAASNPTKRSPIFVYALHLIELTSRTSNMALLGNPSSTPGHGHTDHAHAPFDAFEQHAAGISVQTLTAVSPFPTMHQDVCLTAADKHAAFILLPFHKHQAVDGMMEAADPAIRTVNENVLSNAPCSVGILVDRGLGARAPINSISQRMSRRVAVLFFGGPDDREALAYARRMAEHPRVSLTVVRFVVGEESKDSRVVTIVADEDEVCLTEFRLRFTDDESLAYIERVVSGGEETVAVIRAMDGPFDLFVVGRGKDGISPLTAGLTEFAECPELGAIGDLLASSDFVASVLVVQQYVPPEVESPGEVVEQYLSNRNQRGRVMAGTHKGAPPAPWIGPCWTGLY